MNATKSKRDFMKWMRKQMTQIKNDPYLKPHGEDIVVEMVKWSKRSRAGLFVVYSRSHGKVLWNTDWCKWEWIHFDFNSGKWKIFEMLNAVLSYCRYPKSF